MSDRSTQRDTRDRILIAAATMLGEDPTARLSVRGVAARAGVSTGSLRHFFPTQRELVETVVAGLYDIEIPDDPIYDTERTPADRLVACLRLLLAEFGAGDRARVSGGARCTSRTSLPVRVKRSPPCTSRSSGWDSAESSVG